MNTKTSSLASGNNPPKTELYNFDKSLYSAFVDGKLNVFKHGENAPALQMHPELASLYAASPELFLCLNDVMIQAENAINGELTAEQALNYLKTIACVSGFVSAIAKAQATPAQI